MGAVLRAHDPELGRDVAIKVILRQHRDDARVLRRFLGEARLTSQLQHPGVAPVYDIGRLPDGRPYFAMKLIEGRTLADLLRQRGDPSHDLPRFLRYFEVICQTVGYAHAQGIIHRDLKPLNVMIGAFGEVQVMDWGMAKVLETPGEAMTPSTTPLRVALGPTDTPQGSHTQEGQVLGTPTYMPPEQARGEIARLDERCDVFALGGILCKILTGQPPYAGMNFAETYRHAVEANLAGAHARLAGCRADAELVRLAEACLAHEPQDRPRDAGHVATAVTSYLASVQQRLQQVEVERAEARARAQAERRARRLTMGLAAAVLGLMLVGGGAWIWVTQEKASRLADEARAQQTRAERQAETARMVNAAMAEAALLRGKAQAAGNDPVKWAAARAEAQRAEALLAGGDGDATLRRRAQALLAELTEETRDRRMLAQLEAARLLQTEVRDSAFDYGRAVPAYAKAFADYGIDVAALAPQVAAARIAARNIRDELVAALDDWARLAGKTSPVNRQRLLAIARAADQDPWRNRLRDALEQRSRPELVKLAQSAEVAKLSATTLVLLGSALHDTGAVREAVALLRQAQRRYPGDFWINRGLGTSLAHLHPPAWEEAVRFHTAALAIRPGPGAYYNLGNALQATGQVDEAIAAFRQAIELQPDFALAYNNLGDALQSKGQTDEAIAAFRRAVRLRPSWATAHANLGFALYAQGELEAAHTAYQQALRLRPDFAGVYTNLGLLLRARGELRASLAAYQRGHELGSKDPNWSYPSAQWVRDAQRFVELDSKLAAVLSGDARAESPEQCVGFAQLCSFKDLPAASARFYAEAFAAKPALAADFRAAHRYHAVGSAARAASGQGADAPPLDEGARRRWREQALVWLKADLEHHTKQLASRVPAERQAVAQALEYWQKDRKLAEVRKPDELAQLPPAEQQAWQQLWADVAKLSERSRSQK
jgi:serine/threonine-protein kinase